MTRANARLGPGRTVQCGQRVSCPQTDLSVQGSATPDPAVCTADTDQLGLGFERKRDVLWKSSHSGDKEAEGQESPRDGVRAGCRGRAAARSSQRAERCTRTHVATFSKAHTSLFLFLIEV